MNKPSDYFKKLDLAHLDANTAQFIREKILTLPNVDILEGTKEFETIKAIVEENFPRAIGIEPIIEVTPEPIVEEVVEEIIEPIIDTKQEEIKTISGQVSEMTDLIDLLSELVAENPSDLDSLDVLELYKENLVELSNKLKSLTEVITEAVTEVKDNIEEVKEIIKTDVVDTKGILTAPKQYKIEDGQNVLGYESDWNFGLNKHLGETVVYYVSNEDDKNKYSVLSGILHKGEIVYSEDKTSNKEFENYSENVEDALKLAYELANDKEAVDKYSLGGVLLGAALGVAGTLGYQKVVAKNSIPVKKEKAKSEKWNDVISAHVDKEGLDSAMSENYSDWKDVKAPAKFHELRTSYLKGKKTLENHIDKKLSGKNKKSVLDAIDKEGFDSAFEFYSDFKEVKDAAFHKLIKSYLKSKKELSDYIGLDKYEKGGVLKNEKYSTLAYKTKKSAEKSASGIKEYFGDRFIKSEVLQGKDERGNYGYQVHYELTKDKFEKGGSLGQYVAVHESKDGYWTIASKPSSKENAEAMLGGTPKNEVGKVVTLEEARAHKKTVGEEYLYEKGGSVSKQEVYKYGYIDGKPYEVIGINHSLGLVRVKNFSESGAKEMKINEWIPYTFELGTPATFIDDKGREVSGEIISRNGRKAISLYKDSNYSGIHERIIFLDEIDLSTLKSFMSNKEKFENGGEIKNIDKIKKSIGDTVFNHISSLNEEQLEKQLRELKVELNREYSDSNGKSERYKKLNDEMYYILYRLERAADDFTFRVGQKVQIIDEPKSSQKPYEVIGHENYNEKYGWETIIKNGDEKLTMFENMLEKYKGDSDKDENIAKIRFNDHWKTVQLYIDGSLYGEFDTYQEAVKEAEGNRSKVVLVDDITMLNISSENPLSRQLAAITGDGWNDIDYENLDGSKNVTTAKPFKHVKSGKIFEVYKK